MHSTIGFILKSDAHKNTQDQILPKKQKKIKEIIFCIKKAYFNDH